jgi:hypothetical protein
MRHEILIGNGEERGHAPDSPARPRAPRFIACPRDPVPAPHRVTQRRGLYRGDQGRVWPSDPLERGPWGWPTASPAGGSVRHGGAGRFRGYHLAFRPNTVAPRTTTRGNCQTWPTACLEPLSQAEAPRVAASLAVDRGLNPDDRSTGDRTRL